MKEFAYTITDEIGIHARPAGLLVRESKKFQSNITISYKDIIANAKSLFAIMGLGIKKGDTVTVTADGIDEADAIKDIELFFKENL